MTKRGANGETVVCSEKTRARGKVKSLVMAVAAVGLAGVSTAHAQVLATDANISIVGTATGDQAISVGSDSWATSLNGVANGKNAIATGTDISRAEFEALMNTYKDAVDLQKAAQQAADNARNNIDANNAAIDSLDKQIADLTKQQQDVADKIAQRDRLNNQKDALNNDLANKQDALNQANSALATAQDT